MHLPVNPDRVRLAQPHRRRLLETAHWRRLACGCFAWRIPLLHHHWRPFDVLVRRLRCSLLVLDLMFERQRLQHVGIQDCELSHRTLLDRRLRLAERHRWLLSDLKVGIFTLKSATECGRYRLTINESRL